MHHYYHYPIPSLRPVIAAYELNYQKGKVISFGIYSDDIITNEKFDKYFDNLVLQNTQKQQQQQSLTSLSIFVVNKATYN
jgi:hypothetical protein